MTPEDDITNHSTTILYINGETRQRILLAALLEYRGLRVTTARRALRCSRLSTGINIVGEVEELSVEGDLTIRGVTRKGRFAVEGPTPPVKGNERTRREGGRTRVKARFGFGLARNRRCPKRLSEQRLSGVPPVEGGVVEGEQLLLRAHFKSANSRFFVQVVVDGIS